MAMANVVEGDLKFVSAQWQCQVCTFRNEASLVKCEICEIGERGGMVVNVEQHEYDRITHETGVDSPANKRPKTDGDIIGNTKLEQVFIMPILHYDPSIRPTQQVNPHNVPGATQKYCNGTGVVQHNNILVATETLAVRSNEVAVIQDNNLPAATEARTVDTNEVVIQDNNTLAITETQPVANEVAVIRGNNTPIVAKEVQTAATTGNNIDENAEQDLLQKYQNYSELEAYYNGDLITCLDHFECKICLSDQYPGEGVTLKDCLHSFCEECLVRAIECNTEAEVKCPYSDDDYKCTSVLQDREIKALVSPEVYNKHLSRSIKEAEQTIENTFHCLTADCGGWCVIEDNIDMFPCPVCLNSNCLKCKAIHKDLTCEQYKESLTTDKNEIISRKRLQQMIMKRQAMHCPKCQMILQKDTGCDWLCCTVCKTEICWATRGPRWGPRGHGDTSGGCKCRVGGKRCHPKCGNCH